MNEAAIESEQTTKKHSWQLTAIIAVTLVPLIAAYVAYYTGIGVPDETVNEGVLVEPAINVKDLIVNAGGEAPSFEHNRLWRLFIPVPSDCDAACENNLFVTRQVHLRLGEKAARVERYAVLLDQTGEQRMSQLKEDHPRLKFFQVSSQQYREWLAPTNVPAMASKHQYMLVDQLGFAMMVYSEENDGNQLLKDIKRVLRYSPED